MTDVLQAVSRNVQFLARRRLAYTCVPPRFTVGRWPVSSRRSPTEHYGGKATACRLPNLRWFKASLITSGLSFIATASLYLQYDDWPDIAYCFMETSGHTLHISCRHPLLEGDGDQRALKLFLSSVRYYSRTYFCTRHSISQLLYHVVDYLSTGLGGCEWPKAGIPFLAGFTYTSRNIPRPQDGLSLFTTILQQMS